MADQQTGVAPDVLKIIVFASGQIHLNGREASLSELEDVLPKARAEGSLVEYLRENASSDGPPEADAVIDLIRSNKLRIALSPVNPKNSSNVIELPGSEHFFAKVRRLAAGQRGVAVVANDRTHFVLPAPRPGAITPQMIEAVGAVIPSEEPRNIAAIAPGGTLAGSGSKQPSVAELAGAIPFFGLLIGLAYAEHAVWIFEALPQTFPVGFEEADVLIVDSDAIANLPARWLEDAGAIMRNSNILIYDRSRQKMGAVRTAGVVPGRIEFPNS